MIRNLTFAQKIMEYMRWKFRFIDFRLKLINDNPSPEELVDDIIYVVGNNEYQKWVIFKCPSGCGETIMLSLSPNKSPSWEITFDKKNRVNIYPSIHKLDGCKSHFWIKNGKIKWAKSVNTKL